MNPIETAVSILSASIKNLKAIYWFGKFLQKLQLLCIKMWTWLIYTAPRLSCKCKSWEPGNESIAQMKHSVKILKTWHFQNILFWMKTAKKFSKKSKPEKPSMDDALTISTIEKYHFSFFSSYCLRILKLSKTINVIRKKKLISGILMIPQNILIGPKPNAWFFQTSNTLPEQFPSNCRSSWLCVWNSWPTSAASHIRIWSGNTWWKTSTKSFPSSNPFCQAM